MELQPKRQPGRADRKAALYASEIGRLRSDGYTYEAIREALADVGIELSNSALRREVHRLRVRTDGVLSVRQPAWRIPVGPEPPTSLVRVPLPPALAGSSSRDIAEAFFNAHPSNPLLRTKDVP